MTRPRALAAIVSAAAALSACTHSNEETRQSRAPAKETPESGRVTVLDDGGTVDAPYVAGDALYGVSEDGRREKLARGMNALLIANLAPAAVPSPQEESVIAYNSWRGTTPVVRLRDVARNRDVVLDEGAYSVAWRRDGAVAHFKAVKPEVDAKNIKAYVGHVVVRPSPNARPVRWTTRPGRYVVAAWAGETLLVYRLPGTTFPDLLALDGPGKVRVLAKRSALIAISPDGERTFVSRYGAKPPVVRVLDAADGSEAASFEFGRESSAVTGSPVRWLSESGSWAGELVFATSSEGIIVFSVGADEIELEQVVKFDSGAFPLGVFEPQSDESGRRIVGWAQLAELPRQPVPDAAVLECDRLELRCKLGPPVSSVVGPRLVYNPSRP